MNHVREVLSLGCRVHYKHADAKKDQYTDVCETASTQQQNMV
jgi:hypothetical protein